MSEGDQQNEKQGTTVIDAVATTIDPSENGGFAVYMGEDHKNLDCRFYENPFPEIESVVMVNVRNIADMGAYVSLMEYNHIEGMILLSELSRRRIRSIHKLIRVNRNEIVMVTSKLELLLHQKRSKIDFSTLQTTSKLLLAQFYC